MKHQQNLPTEPSDDSERQALDLDPSEWAEENEPWRPEGEESFNFAPPPAPLPRPPPSPPPAEATGIAILSPSGKPVLPLWGGPSTSSSALPVIQYLTAEILEWHAEQQAINYQEPCAEQWRQACPAPAPTGRRSRR